MRAYRIALAGLVLFLSSASFAESQTAASQASPAEACRNAVKTYTESSYKFLFYDAALGKTYWAEASTGPYVAIDDYTTLLRATTKDQIVVIVCGLRFDTTVNVTANSIGLPERGLNVRGIAPATASSNSSSTDALQTALASTNSVLAALIAPASSANSPAANSIVTPGSLDQDGKYTPAKISITPEDLRHALDLYGHQAEALREQIRALNQNLDAQSAAGIRQQTSRLRLQLSEQIKSDAKNNTGAFDEARTQVLQISSHLTALNSEIATLAPGTRAAALASSYNSTLSGLVALERIRQQDDDFLKTPVPAASADCASHKPAGNKASSTAQQPSCKDDAATNSQNSRSGRIAERDALLQFNKDLSPGYHLDAQKQIISTTGQMLQPAEIYAELRTLKKNLQAIDEQLRQSFQLLDDWRAASSITYADALTPGSGNQAIRIGISVSDNYTPFTLSYSSSSATTPAGNAGHYAATAEVLVERRTYFNFTGGFLAINIPTKSYTLVESTVPTPAAGSSFSPCNSASTVTVSTSGTIPTYYCPVINQKTPWQVGGIAAITYFPLGRNYFPRHLQIGRAPSSSIAKDLASDFGLMLGTSVTQLGSGFGGVSFEPLYGLNFYAGIASASSTRLASGGGSNHDIYTTSTAPTIQNLHVGLSLGIGFDFNVFTSIFKNGAIGPSIP